MKPITGSVVSSKPVSLSKAASILSRFVVSDTRAQQDVSACLRRTSEAFNELVDFHEDLRERRGGSSVQAVEEVERRGKKKRKDGALVEVAKNRNFAVIEGGNPGPSVGLQRGRALGSLGLEETKSREKKRVGKEIGGEVGNIVVIESERKVKKIREGVQERWDGDGNVENRGERQRMKKRKKEENVKDGSGDGVQNHMERHHKKKGKVKEEF